MGRQVSLSILDQVRIASPCTADWEQMRGDDRVRHCGQCQLNVYNIAEMPREEAEALILGHEGRLCIRLFRRTDGTVITRDCPVGVARARRAIAIGVARLGTAIAAVLSLATIVGARVTGRESARLRGVQPFATLCEWISPSAPFNGPIAGQMIMGDIAVPPPPPKPAPAPTRAQ